MSYFIAPSEKTVKEALASWTWLDFKGNKPILVTAFGDVFFQADEGIWFLDTTDGKLTPVCRSREELNAILSTEEGRDCYLFAPLVDQAASQGQGLGPGQCYDFKIPPILGGAMEYANMAAADFMVALDIRGQIHDQVRALPAGTRIKEIKVAPSKQWWKFW